MKCEICGNEKLSREFPRKEHSDDCEHPQGCCLRCSVRLLREGHRRCPHEGCQRLASEGFLDQCEQEIEYLFPSPPSTGHTVVASPVPLQNPRSATSTTPGVVIATFLSGEHCSVPYDPRKTIAQVKNEIQQEMKVAATKQKLFFGETELSAVTVQRTVATLGYYKIQPGCSIQVHVQLYEIPSGLRSAVFDLSWGYPRSSWRRDYLDATAFCYHGRTHLAFTDFRSNHNYKVNLDGAIHHSGHSGGLMDDRARIGRHRIMINFDNIPMEVDTIFLTLSSWRAPNMSLFRSPTLYFYDPARPDEQLCENYVRRAPYSKGIVMCAIRRTSQGWEVLGIGRETAGNARNYRPIRQTLHELASGFV